MYGEIPPTGNIPCLCMAYIKKGKMKKCTWNTVKHKLKHSHFGPTLLVVNFPYVSQLVSYYVWTSIH